MPLTTGTSYFLQAKEGGYIKIGGTTGEPRKRPYAQLFDGGRELVCLGICNKTEAEVQALFPELHVRGDWFEPGGSLIKFIQEHAQQTEEEYKAFYKARPTSRRSPALRMCPIHAEYAELLGACVLNPTRGFDEFVDFALDSREDLTRHTAESLEDDLQCSCDECLLLDSALLLFYRLDVPYVLLQAAERSVYVQVGVDWRCKDLDQYDHVKGKLAYLLDVLAPCMLRFGITLHLFTTVTDIADRFTTKETVLPKTQRSIYLLYRRWVSDTPASWYKDPTDLRTSTVCVC